MKVTDEYTEIKLEGAENAPFLVHEEDAPIVSMELIAALAAVYNRYTDELINGDYAVATYEILPQVYDLTWQFRAEAKEAVKVRGIPIDGTRIISYQCNNKELNGKEIFGEFHRYVGLAFPLPNACTFFCRDMKNGDAQRLMETRAWLNYELFDVGFKALQIEAMDHDGLHTWMRHQEALHTADLKDEPAQAALWAEKVEADHALESWRRARNTWQEAQAVSSNRLER